MKAIFPLSISLVASLALAACASPRPQPGRPVVIQPRPIPRPAPLPAPPADWRDAAQTAGNWTWSMTGGRSTASFGLLGAGPLATLTCDRSAGRVLLARAGNGSAQVPMAVATSSLRRPLLSDPARSGASWQVVALGAADPLLDAIAFSRGRFALESVGLPTLYLPAWPEISRVIEDCR